MNDQSKSRFRRFPWPVPVEPVHIVITSNDDVEKQVAERVREKLRSLTLSRSARLDNNPDCGKF